MRVLVVIPPAPLISLDDAKAHLRVTDSSEDTLITAYIAAASAHIDGPTGWLGRAIGQQTLEWRGDGWDCLIVPFPPVIAITSIKYLDTLGAEQTLANDQYVVRGSSIGRAHAASWPSRRCDPEGVRIRYVAGYETVPAPIVAAVLLMVGDLYGQRETAAAGTMSSVPMSVTVEHLLAPFRVFT